MTTKNENQEPRDKEARDQDQASGDKGILTCKAKNCTNSLYKWTSSLDARYCIDCLG